MEIAKKPEKLRFETLDGISKEQLLEHYEVLYKGYVKKINEIRLKLNSVSKETANATFSEFRALKSEETFAQNGVVLHERYFAKLGGQGGKPDGEIAKFIEDDFGSFEKWKEDFVACGMAARGWVVLAFDFNDNRLRNYVCDVHNHGGVWGCAPLLVMDVYEHAYFLDYATNRAAYIESFFRNIDWKKVNSLLKALNVENRRLELY